MIDYLIQLENQRIISEISKKLANTGCFGANHEADLIGIKVDIPLIAAAVHSQLILDLVFTFLCGKKINNALQMMLKGFIVGDSTEFQVVHHLNLQEIPFLAESLHISFLNSRFDVKHNKLIRVKSKESLIEKGAVYTRPDIAQEIVDTTLENLGNIPIDISILDFACGSGRFYEAAIKSLVSRGFSIEDAVLKNVFALDIDCDAVNITRFKAVSFLYAITFEKIETITGNILHKNGLMRNSIFCTDNLAIDVNDLNGRFVNGFDVIVSNPPYLVLKPNKNKVGKNNASKISEMVDYFRKSGVYTYAIEGMLNLYQISIESMLSMLKNGGEMGVICPSTLFADVSASKLRRHLLSANKIRAIKYFPEKIRLFENIAQATNIFYLSKSAKTDKIEVAENGFVFSISFNLISELFPENLEIPFIGEKEWEILKKLSALPKLKDLPNIRNRRGELDLSLNKQFITKKPTPFRLVRGNMINDSFIQDINGEFVSECFIKTRSSDFINKDFLRKRLVCQQVSNGCRLKRLNFVFSEPSDILANSCNYISGNNDILEKFFLLLNSNILNWRFKITSSNNHINNYEIGELPVANLDLIDASFKYSCQEELDHYIGKAYGLTNDEIHLISSKI